MDLVWNPASGHRGSRRICTGGALPGAVELFSGFIASAARTTRRSIMIRRLIRRLNRAAKSFRGTSYVVRRCVVHRVVSGLAQMAVAKAASIADAVPTSRGQPVRQAAIGGGLR